LSTKTKFFERSCRLVGVEFVGQVGNLPPIVIVGREFFGSSMVTPIFNGGRYAILPHLASRLNGA